MLRSNQPAPPSHWPMMAGRFLIASGLLFSLTLTVTAGDDDKWPSWRGPLLTGVAEGAGYATEWDKEKNVDWALAMPDIGGSTPAVWGDSIFITASRDGDNILICVGFDGSIKWEKNLGVERRGKHRKGTACNPSPVTDGEHVFVYYKSGDLGCFDFDGNQVWHKNLQDEYGEDTLWWDLGTSPVLSSNYLVVACVQSGPSYLAAFEKETGDVAWKVDRNLDAPEEANQTYATPQVIQHDGSETIIVLGADHVTAHSAEDGSELWRVGDMNPSQNKFFRSISSPVVFGDMVIAPYARGESLTGIRLGGSGNVTESHVAWSFSGSNRDVKGADVPTPIAHDGRVYVCSDKGHVTCRDIESGDVLWEGDLERSGTTYSASPVKVGDLIYFTREDGTTLVFEANETMKLVAKNELDEYTVATPVFVNGKILLRTFENLYCISQ